MSVKESAMGDSAYLTQINPIPFTCHHLLPRRKKLALVVEGGGMRGIFSAGVLDSFHELDFDPFDLYFGVSAGSLNLSSHLAGQYQRNYRVMMYSATSNEFISGWNYLRGGHYVDLDWLASKCIELHPLDKQGAMKHLKDNDKKFTVVCTNLDSGEPNYYRPNGHNLLKILTGSCCIPLLYRNPVYIAGERVIDGGIGDPIPAKKAYIDGATDIIVIRTREKQYRELENSMEKKFGSFYYRQYPGLQQSIRNLANTYNDSIEFIENPPQALNIFQIAPQHQLKTNLITTDPEMLENDYQLGRRLGKEFVYDYLQYSKPDQFSKSLDGRICNRLEPEFNKKHLNTALKQRHSMIPG